MRGGINPEYFRFRPPVVGFVDAWTDFLNQRWGLILPELRWLYVGVRVSTPCGAVSIRENIIFVQEVLELYRYGGVRDTGMGSYLPRVALAPHAPANQRSASGIGVSTSCGAVPT